MPAELNKDYNVLVVNDSWTEKHVARHVSRLVARSLHSDRTFTLLNIQDLIDKVKEWKKELPRITPFYALKCNYNPILLEVLTALGVCFDCASMHEIELVLKTGADADRIIFAHTAKPRAHLIYARQHGVELLTFDSDIELLKVKQFHPNAKLIVRIRCDALIVVNVLGNKFGCCAEKEAPALLRIAKELNLKVVGVSFHVGSMCGEKSAYRRGIIMARKLFDFGWALGHHMQILDIGGGFPGDVGTSISEIAQDVNATLDEYFPPATGVEIIAEPGRYFTASAFTLACCVHSAKRPPSIVKEEENQRTYFVEHQDEVENVNVVNQREREEPMDENNKNTSNGNIDNRIIEEIDHKEEKIDDQDDNEKKDSEKDEGKLKENGKSKEKDGNDSEKPNGDENVSEKPNGDENCSEKPNGDENKVDNQNGDGGMEIDVTPDDQNAVQETQKILIEVVSEEIAREVAKNFANCMRPVPSNDIPKWIDNMTNTLKTNDKGQVKHVHQIMYYMDNGLYGSFAGITSNRLLLNPEPLEEIDLPKLPSSLWGPTCDGVDMVMPLIYLPPLPIPSWLLFPSFGAYTSTTSSNFNGFGPPAEYAYAKQRTWNIIQKLPYFHERGTLFGIHTPAEIPAPFSMGRPMPVQLPIRELIASFSDTSSTTNEASSPLCQKLSPTSTVPSPRDQITLSALSSALRTTSLQYLPQSVSSPSSILKPFPNNKIKIHSELLRKSVRFLQTPEEASSSRIGSHIDPRSGANLNTPTTSQISPNNSPSSTLLTSTVSSLHYHHTPISTLGLFKDWFSTSAPNPSPSTPKEAYERVSAVSTSMNTAEPRLITIDDLFGPDGPDFGDVQNINNSNNDDNNDNDDEKETTPNKMRKF